MTQLFAKNSGYAIDNQELTGASQFVILPGTGAPDGTDGSYKYNFDVAYDGTGSSTEGKGWYQGNGFNTPATGEVGSINYDFDHANTQDVSLSQFSGPDGVPFSNPTLLFMQTVTWDYFMLTLFGGDDTMYGSAHNDKLSGYAGNDVIFGGYGDKPDSGTFDPGELEDPDFTMYPTYGYASDGMDELRGNDGDDTLDGGTDADMLYGGAGMDTLFGGGGAWGDTLNGGLGADSMTGGKGDDTYVVDDAGDTVNELASEGTDTVQAKRSYTLGSNVENLDLIGFKKINGTGNELDNTITGNGKTNILNGGIGEDFLNGGGGNRNQLFGGVGDDELHSGTGNNNTLDGGAGADTMLNNGGSATFVVDNVGDTVEEWGSEGIETVNSTISFALGSQAHEQIENLRLMAGAGDINATGNQLNNKLWGNEGKNTLEGGDGNDKQWGGDGDDHVHGGAGNDKLWGGGGKDHFMGGTGDDKFYVDQTNEVIVENAGEGLDTVLATASYTLGNHLENLTLQSGAPKGSPHLALDGTGNELDNTILGNNANNVLSGMDGDDTLKGKKGADTFIGGMGADTMYGGPGSFVDVFQFNDIAESGIGAGNRDVVRQFKRGQDKIDLSGIDANDSSGTDNDFNFSKRGNEKANSVWVVKQPGKVALVRGDVDGDKVHDFEIEVAAFNLNAADFIL